MQESLHSHKDMAAATELSDKPTSKSHPPLSSPQIAQGKEKKKGKKKEKGKEEGREEWSGVHVGHVFKLFFHWKITMREYYCL